MVAPYARTTRPPQPDETGTTVCIPVTNAIEALNAKLRSAVRSRGHFPTDEAALKLLYLVGREQPGSPQKSWDFRLASGVEVAT